MHLRPFGDTGLALAPLGLGAGPLGDHALDEARVERLLRGAIELGVGLVDTAPSYGCSEERLGRLLRGDRERVVLSTKLGYGVPGVPDWTGECITGGVDQALRRLATDRLDIAHLHSCGPEVLARDDVLRALEAAVQAGKVRLAGYSGDGEGLRVALRIPLFRVFQVSVSLVDQEALEVELPAGVGVIGKRSFGNAAFLQIGEPEREDVREYWRRWQLLRAELPERVARDVAVEALRFAAHAGRAEGAAGGWRPHVILLGTTSLENLAAAVAAVERGALDGDEHQAIRAAWGRYRWPGMI